MSPVTPQVLKGYKSIDGFQSLNQVSWLSPSDVADALVCLLTVESVLLSACHVAACVASHGGTQKRSMHILDITEGKSIFSRQITNTLHQHAHSCIRTFCIHSQACFGGIKRFRQMQDYSSFVQTTCGIHWVCNS